MLPEIVRFGSLVKSPLKSFVKCGDHNNQTNHFPCPSVYSLLSTPAEPNNIQQHEIAASLSDIPTPRPTAPTRFRVSKFNLCILYDAAASAAGSPSWSVAARSWSPVRRRNFSKFRKIDFLLFLFRFRLFSGDLLGVLVDSVAWSLEQWHSPLCSAIPDAPISEEGSPRCTFRLPTALPLKLALHLQCSSLAAPARAELCTLGPQFQLLGTFRGNYRFSGFIFPWSRGFSLL